MWKILIPCIAAFFCISTIRVANGVNGSGAGSTPVNKTWALLVAGSNGYYNYRHQADICHAYHILIAHKIPPENIIVMMYDDIAFNEENPTKGILINHPNGHDVYANVIKDYTGEDVTPSNFLKILSGDERGMRGIGSGKVIKSTKNDRIFVNFVDHGAPGILAFPSSELTAREFKATLTKMFKKKSYAEMVIYIEACESGSMFRNILPNNMNIFATTAANSTESSYACYMDEYRHAMLGDCYSVNWMEDTDKRDISRESLYDQYVVVKAETNLSHVMEFGDLSIARQPVADFQGEGPTGRIHYPSVDKTPVLSHEVPLYLMQMKMTKSNDKRVEKQYKSFLKMRKYLEKTAKTVAREISESEEQAQRWIDTKPEEINDLFCHSTLVHEFSDKCFNFGKSPYALRFAYLLVNMCNDGVSVSKAVHKFEEICGKTSLLYRDNIH